MALWNVVTKDELLRRQVATHLKRCPLCESLNSISNRECVTCRWHGAFEHDPELVEASFNELIDRCPELIDAFPERPSPSKAPVMTRIRTWLRRKAFRMRKRLDLSV